MSWIDLVTTNNQIVRIEIPDGLEDEFWERLEGCMKQGDWITLPWNKCTMKLNGLLLNRVHASRIVGTL